MDALELRAYEFRKKQYEQGYIEDYKFLIPAIHFKYLSGESFEFILERNENNMIIYSRFSLYEYILNLLATVFFESFEEYTECSYGEKIITNITKINFKALNKIIGMLENEIDVNFVRQLLNGIFNEEFEWELYFEHLKKYKAEYLSMTYQIKEILEQQLTAENFSRLVISGY